MKRLYYLSYNIDLIVFIIDPNIIYLYIKKKALNDNFYIF